MDSIFEYQGLIFVVLEYRGLVSDLFLDSLASSVRDLFLDYF